MSTFRMPALGADMERGTLVQWHVRPGDVVHRGDIVAVVETHKGLIDVEVFEDGTVAELLAHAGDVVPVGGALAELRPLDAAPLAPAAAPAAAPAPFTAAPSVRTRVSPAARRLAASLGIDADRLTGTGTDGSVTLADVELARTQSAPRAAGTGTDTDTRRGGSFDAKAMREAIGTAMSRSKQQIPHYYLSSTVDLGASLAWLGDYNAGRPPSERMLPAALLLKATALALRKVPQLNGFWIDGAFRPGAAIHVGWAISLRGGGLIAPALHEADTLPLPDLMTGLRDLVARARTGGLRSSELMDPTVTVTSLGERGADSVIGVIYPPQVAIVGFGRVVERPWIAGGQVVPRPLVHVSLAADHRASDGHIGGQLLYTLDQLLQEPARL